MGEKFRLLIPSVPGEGTAQSPGAMLLFCPVVVPKDDMMVRAVECCWFQFLVADCGAFRVSNENFEPIVLCGSQSFNFTLR